MELAIDTSTNLAGIALSDSGQIVDEITWQTNQNHTVELIPMINQVLNKNTSSINEISALIIAIGPGSFNGLRVGLTTAKGFSCALSIPLVGICTLDAIAMSCADSTNRIVAMIQAGRGEVAAATYSMVDRYLQAWETPHITNIETILEITTDNTILCGEISDIQMDIIQSFSGRKITVMRQSPDSGRAGYLAKLGWCKIVNGVFDDPSTLQPLYLRKPSITSPKRRQNDAMSNMRKGL